MLPQSLNVNIHLNTSRPADGALSSCRYERQSQGYGGGPQVDYGAYTGKKGSFGWYADYPVYSYGRH